MKAIFALSVLTFSFIVPDTCAAQAQYCPQSLQGQYENNYYYMCQVEEQDKTCTYMYALVARAYQCGGCCPDCCDETCNDPFTHHRERSDGKNVPAAAMAKGDTPLIPKDLSKVTYTTPGAKFATPALHVTAKEVWLTFSRGTTPYYFRCFEVVDALHPHTKLRTGLQLTADDWDAGPTDPTVKKLQVELDPMFVDETLHFHRVTINDTSAASDHRAFYLASADEIQ